MITKVIHLVKLHVGDLRVKFISFCCAALGAVLANAATYTSVLNVSYEGGAPMAEITYSGSFSTVGIEKPDWIGSTSFKMASGKCQMGFTVSKNTTTAPREWTCTVPLGSDSWQITIKQAAMSATPAFSFVPANQLKNYSVVKDWPAGVFLCNNTPVEVTRFKVGSKPGLWFVWHNTGNVDLIDMPYSIEVEDAVTGEVVASMSAVLKGTIAPGQCAYKNDFGLTMDAVGTYNVFLTLDPENTKGLKDRSGTVRGLYGICVYDDPVARFGSVVTGDFPYGSYARSTVVGFTTLTEGNFDTENYPYAFVDKNIVDAEKTSGSGVDKFWCAQLADVNLLTYGGYAKAAGFGNEDALADYLRKNPKVAEGDVISHVLGMGGYDARNARVFLPTDHSTGALAAAFKKHFATGKSLASVGLLFANSETDAVVHVVSVCGYAVDPDVPETDPEHLIGIYYIDSDDDKSGNPAAAPNSMKFCDLCWYPEAGAYLANREYSWEGVDYYGGILYCDGKSLGYFLSADLTREKPSLGFPDTATLTGTCGWAAPIVIYDPNDGKSPKDYNAVTKFEKGEGVYFKFLLENKGEVDFPYADFKAEILNELGIQVAHFTKPSDTGTHVAGAIKCSWGWEWKTLQNLGAGKYRLQITLDPESALGEADGTDNVARIHFEVTEPAKPTVSITFHSNDSHNWNFTFGGFEVGSTLGNPGGLTSVTEKRGFLGWFTAASGGTQVTAGTVVSEGLTDLYAHWQSGEIAPPDDPQKPAEEVVVYSITYDLAGGENAAENPDAYMVKDLPLMLGAAKRPGYRFCGWSRPDGTVFVGKLEDVAGDLALTAIWEPVVPETTPALDLPKAQVLNGIVLDWDEVVGAVQIKLAKQKKDASGRRTSKISAQVTGLDGKKKTAKAAVFDLADSGLTAVRLEVKGWGTLELEIGDDAFIGTLSGEQGDYDVQSSGDVGGNWTKADAGVYVDYDDGIDEIPGEVQDWLLPYGEPVIEKKGKWSFAKAPTVKWAKDKETKEYDLIVDEGKDGLKTNYSALKLTYTPKTGLFKGTFKLYSLEDKPKGKKALKKYTLNVSGIVVDGVGYGQATLKKPACKWPVRVE